jgi:hypothetical protein
MKWTRVLRRATSGTFKFCLANSCARLGALPFATSATTPHSCATAAGRSRPPCITEREVAFLNRRELPVSVRDVI